MIDLQFFEAAQVLPAYIDAFEYHREAPVNELWHLVILNVGACQKTGRNKQQAEIAASDPLLQFVMPMCAAKEIGVGGKRKMIILRCFKSFPDKIEKTFFQCLVVMGIRQKDGYSRTAIATFRFWKRGFDINALIRPVAGHFRVTSLKVLLDIVFKKRLTE